MSREIVLEVDPVTGCHECVSHAPDSEGYPGIKINNLRVRIHRYLYEQENGKLPKGTVVRHTCDNPSCCNLSHLIPGTNADNVQDRVNRDRSARGARNGRAKLSLPQVTEIRASEETQTALAKRYWVSRATIQQILNGKIWQE